MLIKATNKRRIMENPVLVYYWFEKPIVINYDDAPVLIAQSSNDIVITNMLDLLVCNTIGNFIDRFGIGCVDRDKFRTIPNGEETEIEYLELE